MCIMFTNLEKPYLIGETAYNHEGNYEYLMEMIDEIYECGLDAIKFHLLLNPKSYMVENHPLMDKVTEWGFDKKQWSEIIKYTSKKNLDVITLCDDVESIEFIKKSHPNVRGIELHASALNDYFSLEKLIDYKGTVILGIGGSSLDEIHFAIDFLKKFGKHDILLMYGFQSFPTKYDEINLSKMKKIRNLFNLPVGYADHTSFDDEYNELISIMAMMAGFPILEKHFTLDPGVKRIDYHAAVGIEKMKKIKHLMELAFNIYGNEQLTMSVSELKYGNTGPMKKAIVSRNRIKSGEVLSKENLWFKRTIEESPIEQKDFLKLLGLKASKNIEKDEIVDFSKAHYEFKQPDLKTIGLK